jgi:phage major head subunit gpT-like protein
MASVIQTGLLEPGLRSEFFERFSQAEAAALWPMVCTTIKSERAEEKFGFLGATPPLREWGTGRVARGLFTDVYSLKNLKYESTLEIDRDEISDDATSQLRVRVAEMAERAALHKDSLLAQLLASGHSSGFNSYDGVSFFSASHASGLSGTQSNLVTADAADPDAPTSAEVKGALSLALPRLMSFKDDQGEPLNQNLSGLIAVIPPNMLVSFNEALSATIVASTSNVLSGLAKIHAFARLPDTDVFFLLKTDVSVRPFVLLDREAIEFRALAEGSAEEFLREKYYYGVRGRYRVAYGYWQRAIRVKFETPSP